MNGTAFQDKISCIIYRITKSIADRLCRSIILFPACIKAVYLTAPGIKTPVYATNFLSGIFAQIAEAIAEGEDVFMLAGPSSIESAKAAFSGKSENIHILPIETDDAWARDVGRSGQIIMVPL